DSSCQCKHCNGTRNQFGDGELFSFFYLRNFKCNGQQRLRNQQCTNGYDLLCACHARNNHRSDQRSLCRNFRCCIFHCSCKRSNVLSLDCSTQCNCCFRTRDNL